MLGTCLETAVLHAHKSSLYSYQVKISAYRFQTKNLLQIFSTIIASICRTVITVLAEHI